MRMMLRMIGKLSMLDALISKTKQRLLAAILLQPERSWYLLELARHLGVTPSSLQRELGLLTEVGILKRRQNGNRVYFQADPACPISGELAVILTKTVGLMDLLKKALAPLQNEIDIAVVYGSMAAGRERSGSDVDLLVIGAASLSELAAVLRPVESDIGRAINPTVYTRQEFKNKIHERAHFLNRVLRSELLFIYGTQGELEKLASNSKGKTAPDQRPRTARPSRSRRARS